MTKCPFADPSCNNHPKTAQNCQRNYKKCKDCAKNDKKCALFTNFYEKITKNTNFSPFFCRIRAPNLPLSAKPKTQMMRHYISIYAYTYILSSSTPPTSQEPPTPPPKRERLRDLCQKMQKKRTYQSTQPRRYAGCSWRASAKAPVWAFSQPSKCTFCAWGYQQLSGKNWVPSALKLSL